jgi:hypothetical protein
MATKKQRRRRDKTFRHEYGFVTYDEEGNEVEVESSDVREKKPEKPKTATPAKKGGKPARTMREPSPPSWRRSLKRGGLFGGLIFVLVVFVMPAGNRTASVVTGLFYALAFIPLTYWIDRLTYRTWLKRQGGTASKS